MDQDRRRCGGKAPTVSLRRRLPYYRQKECPELFWERGLETRFGEAFRVMAVWATAVCRAKFPLDGGIHGGPDKRDISALGSKSGSKVRSRHLDIRLSTGLSTTHKSVVMLSGSLNVCPGGSVSDRPSQAF